MCRSRARGTGYLAVMQMPPLLISAVEEPGLTIYLEPEGAEHRVAVGQRVSVVFPPGKGQVELLWVSSGLILGRDATSNEYPTLTDQDGRTLDW